MIKKITIFLILTGLFSFWFYNWKIERPLDADGEDKVFVVAAGQGVNMVSANLYAASLIKSDFFFRTHVWLADQEEKIKAGEYVLSPKLSIREITDILVAGKIVSNEAEVTILEGWNMKEAAVALAKAGFFKEDEFIFLAGRPMVDYRGQKNAPKDFSAQFSFLADKPKYRGLEGYLFPDTYRFFKNASPEDVILKMLSNFEKKIFPEMAAVKSSGRTLYEIVTMASILEKEVRSEEDMKIVSGIFWKRIKIGQPLESCASLAYILGVNKPQYSLEDTKVDSPYNTYRNYGLPPGPISNPGLSALRAAIHPKETKYNYFLTDPNTGETVFSATYEEHLRNKRKYLR